MKKQFSMVLALLLAVTLTACGTVSKETAGSTADTAQNTVVNSTAQSADTSNTAADGVSNAALSTVLKELEGNKLIRRTQYNEIPPHVEYEAEPCCITLIPILEELTTWNYHRILAVQDSGS